MKGALFKNNDKKSPPHPDYKGSLEINGVEYWLSAWIRESKGQKYMSIAGTPKGDKTQKPFTRKPAYGSDPF